MSKLYPPTLSNIIPAFYHQGSGVEITVPFTPSKVVGPNSVIGFSLLFKTVANNRLLYTYSTPVNKWDQVANTVTFNIVDAPSQSGVQAWNPDNKLKVGQYYKVQLAYIDVDGVVGHYSNVGTIKFTAKPTVAIEGLSAEKTNTRQTSYVGLYTPPYNDPLEKVYSYTFNVYNEFGALYYSSGELIHNAYKDTSIDRSTTDEFVFGTSLPMNQTFFISYCVTTINGLKESSPKYRIMDTNTVAPEAKVDVIAESNYEHGYVRVQLRSQTDEYGKESAIIGAFILTRGSDKDNFNNWEIVYRFQLNGDLPSSWQWKDFTVEQGCQYKYALQQYNNYLYSDRIESNVVTADFEDFYLYDGERQLRLAFNPKISSFKTTLAEQKIDTIGGQYPYFVRNGRMSYKEFPVSGLLSYLTDSEELFCSQMEISSPDAHTELTSDNITTERLFKLKVLDWLNNGKPKLFKSATEGNYIVRLLNVSLTPNDTLGRMVHVFQATAYEIDEFSYDALVKHGFLSVALLKEVSTTRWDSVDINRETPLNSNLLVITPATSLTISDVYPGTSFNITLSGSNDSLNIVVGSTGMYKIDLSDNVKIESVTLPTPYTQSGGLITYSYSSEAQNVFDSIVESEISDCIFNQYTGEQLDIIGDIEEAFDYTEDGVTVSVQGLRTTLLKFNYLRFYKREVYDLYCANDATVFTRVDSVSDATSYDQYQAKYTTLFEKSGNGVALSKKWQSGMTYYRVKSSANFYWDEACTNVISAAGYKESCLYRVHTPHGIWYLDRREDQPDRWYENCEFKIIVDNNTTSNIDITDTGGCEIPSDVSINALYISNGVICECSYITKTLVYNVEMYSAEQAEAFKELRQAKYDYLLYWNRYLSLLRASIVENNQGLYTWDSSDSSRPKFKFTSPLDGKQYTITKHRDYFVDEGPKTIAQIKTKINSWRNYYLIYKFDYLSQLYKELKAIKGGNVIDD